LSQTRTPAQAAQDKNKAADGTFRHAISTESPTVLGSEPLGEKVAAHAAARITPGATALSNTKTLINETAAANYIEGMSELVTTHYPDAHFVNYTSVEEGGAETLVFKSLTDAQGNQIEVDESVLSKGGSAFAGNVDSLQLSLMLDYDGENELGQHESFLDVTDYKPKTAVQRQVQAEEYEDRIRSIQEQLEVQRAQAGTAVAAHEFKSRVPDAKSFVLGRNRTGKFAVESVTTDKGTFCNPTVSGDNSGAGDIEWFYLDGVLDKSIDFDSMTDREVSMDEALNWAPGSAL